MAAPTLPYDPSPRPPRNLKKPKQTPLSEEPLFLFRRYALAEALNSKYEADELIAAMSPGFFRSFGSATPDIMVRWSPNTLSLRPRNQTLPKADTERQYGRHANAKNYFRMRQNGHDDQPLSDLMRAERRDILRAAALDVITPYLAPRCSSGCAKTNAARAAFLSPATIAASTAFTALRIRLARMRLTAVRRVVCRILFSADLWVAIADLCFRSTSEPDCREAALIAVARAMRQGACDDGVQRLRKFGLRFSTNANMPSF